MAKMWCKIIDNNTKRCEVGIGTNESFFKKLGMKKMDVEKGNDNIYYLKGYAPTIANDDYTKRRIQQLKSLIQKYDYIGIKISTGCATVNEYQDEIKLCEEYRKEIEQLEQMVVKDGSSQI